jgi:hypothetical protein
MNPEHPLLSPDSSGAIAPNVRLRALLHSPKPADAQWQEEAGRMVAMLAVRYPQQADDVDAFSTMALIGLAATKGVKEAKKRSLNLTRWSKAAPPNVEVLSDAEEQGAAVAAISKLKAPWAAGYLEFALSSSSVDVGVLPDLLRWLRRETGDWVAFVAGPFAAVINKCPDDAHALAVLKEGPKLLRYASLVPVDRAGESLAVLVRAITDCSCRFTDDPKVAGQLLASGFVLLEQAWQALPTLLLQPAMLNAITQLGQAMRALKKPLPTCVETATWMVFSLVSDSIKRFGDDGVRQFQPLVPLWSVAFPDFQKQFKQATVAEPALDALVSRDNQREGDGGQRYAAEAAFSILLPAWEAFVANLPDPESAASLSSMMRHAAASVSVEILGTVDDVVDYDPLSQHLAEAGSDMPRRVRVVRTGVVARRQDGSVRTLVPMLVNAM